MAQFKRKILDARMLSEWCKSRDENGNGNVIESPWKGLYVLYNMSFTGFTIMRADNVGKKTNQHVCHINMLSARGKYYTSYVPLQLPSSYMKRDQQCMPLDMGKPRCNDTTPARIMTDLRKESSWVKVNWHGSDTGRCGWIEPTTLMTRGALIYDDKGELACDLGECWPDAQLGGAEVNPHTRHVGRAPLWLQGKVQNSCSDSREWYQSIYNVLDSVKGHGVNVKGMLTLAARTYAAYCKVQQQIPHSRIHLLPMQNEDENESPFGNSYSFSAVDKWHYLGYIEKGQGVHLPTIVLCYPRVVTDIHEQGHMGKTLRYSYCYDVHVGEQAVIPPVGHPGLKRRDNSSIGLKGRIRRKDSPRPIYNTHTLTEHIRKDDAWLLKQENITEDSERSDALSDKYRPWSEPWRTFLGMARDMPHELSLDHGGYSEDVRVKDLQKLLCNSQDCDDYGIQKEGLMRSLLHDFYKDKDHVLVKRILKHEDLDLPRAVHVDELGKTLIAEQLMKQLPLS